MSSKNQIIINKIAASKDSLATTLSASPFENDSIIDANFFFKELYVRHDIFTDELISDLQSPDCEVISIQGFSGTGKTSFVNNLIRNKLKSLAFCDIDCAKGTNSTNLSKFDENNLKTIEKQYEKAGSLEEREELKQLYSIIKDDISEKNNRNAITTIIRQYLIANEQQQIFYEGNLFDGIKEHIVFGFLTILVSEKNKIGRFFQEDFREELNKLDKKEKERERFTSDDWVKLLSVLQIDDAFLFLFLYLEHVFNVLSKKEKKAIKGVIIFDNLDALPSRLLHEQLREKIFFSLNEWKSLSQKDSLGTSFKLILVVRDSNSSAINIHFADRDCFIKEIYRTNEDFYKNVINKRIEFYKKKILRKIGRGHESERKLVTILQDFVKDPFFGSIIVPAFNMDYRKLISPIHQSIRNFLNKMPNSSIYDSNSGAIKDNFRDAFGGVILFDLLEPLKLERFFEKLDPIQVEEGYCLTSRMLLTLVLNSTKINNISEPESLELLEGSDVSLTAILRDAESFYSHEEILENLTKLSLGEDKSPYLLSFINRKIESNWFTDLLEDVVDERYELIKKIKRTEIKGDKVRITPAGIIFLKDLIVHYEIYSKLAKNKKALFSYSWDSTPEGNYLFIDSIYNTLKRVEKHNLWMLNFYNKKFLNSGHNYLNGKFAYKFDDKGKRREIGQFHMARIASSHIEYIDNFRRMFLEENHSMKMVNEKLVRFIGEYINLVSRWKNDDSTLDYIETVKSNIQRIEDSNFNEFNINISVKD